MNNILKAKAGKDGLLTECVTRSRMFRLSAVEKILLMSNEIAMTPHQRKELRRAIELEKGLLDQIKEPKVKDAITALLRAASSILILIEGMGDIIQALKKDLLSSTGVEGLRDEYTSIMDMDQENGIGAHLASVAKIQKLDISEDPLLSVLPEVEVNQIEMDQESGEEWIKYMTDEDKKAFAHGYASVMSEDKENIIPVPDNPTPAFEAGVAAANKFKEKS